MVKKRLFRHDFEVCWPCVAIQTEKSAVLRANCVRRYVQHWPLLLKQHLEPMVRDEPLVMILMLSSVFIVVSVKMLVLSTPSSSHPSFISPSRIVAIIFSQKKNY